MTSPFPNPPVDVNVLLAPTSPQTVLGVIINSLVTMGIRADLWPKEGVAISCMTAVSSIFSGAINTTVIPAVKSGWLPTAVGNWLTWAALYSYGVNRVNATFATGQLTLTNGGGGSFSFGPFEATFQNALTKKTYTNVDPIALAPLGTQTINIQSTEQGTASNAAPGDISIIVSTMLQVSCTNLAAVSGIDTQSDASLQLECWDAIAANSPFGPRQAFAYAVQTAVNSVSGLPVNINRWQITPSSHTGQVQVWVASPAGVPDPNDVTGVANNIEAIARPECVTVTTSPVSVVPDNDTITVFVTATPGLQASDVSAAVTSALTTFFNTYPIGGKSNGTAQGLFASALEGVCYGAWPGVFEVTGANDLALVDGQVAQDSTTVVVRII